MLNIVIILVFSVVMFVFMIFPAMKIVEWIRTQTSFSQKTYDILQILVTIVLSLIVGLFLKFG